MEMCQKLNDMSYLEHMKIKRGKFQGDCDKGKHSFAGACKPDSPDESAISRPFRKLLKCECCQRASNVKKRDNPELILGTVWAQFGSRSSSRTGHVDRLAVSQP